MAEGGHPPAAGAGDLRDEPVAPEAMEEAAHLGTSLLRVGVQPNGRGLIRRILDDHNSGIEGLCFSSTPHFQIQPHLPVWPEAGRSEESESLLALAGRMLEVFYERQEPATEVVGVEIPFEVPLIDQDTGEVLDRPLVGSLDLLERSPEGQLVVVDVKTAGRKYTDLQVEASIRGLPLAHGLLLLTPK